MNKFSPPWSLSYATESGLSASEAGGCGEADGDILGSELDTLGFSRRQRGGDDEVSARNLRFI